MKTTLLVTSLVLACTAFAETTERRPAAKEAPAPASESKTAPAKATPAKTKKSSAAESAVIEKFVSLQDAAIATFLELGDTLQAVKDKESADEAAPTVKMAGEQLCTIISAVESLGEPSEAAQQVIMSRVANVAEKNRITEQVMLPLLTLMMKEPPCYGSEALQTELTNLLANLQGAAGIEEEEVQEADEATQLREPDSDEAPDSATEK